MSGSMRGSSSPLLPTRLSEIRYLRRFRLLRLLVTLRRRVAVAQRPPDALRRQRQIAYRHARGFGDRRANRRRDRKDDLTWLGFRQAQVEYDKQPRAAGRSGWTLGRKVALVADSVTAFTALPIRVCGVLGAALAVIGLAMALYGMAARGLGPLAVVGWITALAGLQLAALGVLGEYLWRALDAARRRPAYFVEREVGIESTGSST